MDTDERDADALLALAREHYDPEPEAVERLLGRLTGPMPPPGSDDTGVASGDPATTPSPWRWRWSALVGGVLGVAIVAGIVATTATTRSESPVAASEPTMSSSRRDPAPAPVPSGEASAPVRSTTSADAVVPLPSSRDSVVVPDALMSEAALVSPPRDAASALAEPSPSPSAPRDARAGRARSVRRDPPPVPEEPAPEEPVAADSSAEIELLKRSRVAVRDQAWSTVERLVQEYRARFPDGRFQEEIAALEVIARCKSTTPDRATRWGQRYLAGGHDMFRRRVSEACGL